MVLPSGGLIAVGTTWLPMGSGGEYWRTSAQQNGRSGAIPGLLGWTVSPDSPARRRPPGGPDSVSRTTRQPKVGPHGRQRCISRRTRAGTGRAYRTCMDVLIRLDEVTKRYDNNTVPAGDGDTWCEALFASGLQPSDTPTAEAVAEAITVAIRQFGIRGCAGRMAREFGDHPDAAAERMRWVRRLAATGTNQYGAAAGLARLDRRSAA
jgi:hypothetical protein